MTTAPDTAPTIHVDVLLDLPLEDGGTFRTAQGIAAIPTETEGLVVFPRLTGAFETDDDHWHVTHVGTGLRIPLTFEDQEHATAYANAAGQLANWADKKPSLPSDVRQKLVRLGQEHGGITDSQFREKLAQQAKEGE